MYYLSKYLKFLLSLDRAVGTDVRNKIDAVSYQNFIQRLTKQMRYDSYAFSRDKDLEF